LESYPQIAALFCAAKGKRELRSVAFYAAMASGVGEKKKQIRLLHDIFGNPFRAMPPKRGSRKWLAQLRSWQTWNGGTIPKLAQGIYDERAFDRLPVLADALEDTGCDDADILSHLRGPGPHVRGCWVRFVDYQYRQIGAGDSSSRGQAESVRQLTNRADAISAEGGSLLKHGPTRRGLTTPARECKGPEGGSVEPDRRYPV